jgi:phenylacetate-coenzyme A ligase PaaK-like adenylate-forming protein
MSLRRTRGHRITEYMQRATARVVVGIGLKNRLELIAARRERHDRITDPEIMSTWQTEAFNQIWVSATQRIRFYAEWKRRHSLPDQLKEISELSKFPILRRRDIDDNFEIIAEDLSPCHFVYSGGTTGNSRRFPRGGRDAQLIYTNHYLGRSWAGISPGDSIVSIWGHEHLFGSGNMRKVKKAIRSTKDWCINTKRLSAYQIDEASVASFFDSIRSRPQSVLISYTSIIRKILDFVEQSKVDGRSARLRAVICSGEMARVEDVDRVRKIFGAVPLIEYGMMETGAMAYSCPKSSALTFFWDAFHCHATSDRELIVSSLQPMHFPLINYDTEDRIDQTKDMAVLPFRCARITGRKVDILQLTSRDGRLVKVCSDLILDILDVIPEVSSYVIRHSDRMLDIGVRGGKLDQVRTRFLRELELELPNIDHVKITFSPLDYEPQTIAGKRQVLVRG